MDVPFHQHQHQHQQQPQQHPLIRNSYPSLTAVTTNPFLDKATSSSSSLHHNIDSMLRRNSAQGIAMDGSGRSNGNNSINNINNIQQQLFHQMRDVSIRGSSSSMGRGMDFSSAMAAAAAVQGRGASFPSSSSSSQATTDMLWKAAAGNSNNNNNHFNGHNNGSNNNNNNYNNNYLHQINGGGGGGQKRNASSAMMDFFTDTPAEKRRKSLLATSLSSSSSLGGLHSKKQKSIPSTPKGPTIGNPKLVERLTSMKGGFCMPKWAKWASSTSGGSQQQQQQSSSMSNNGNNSLLDQSMKLKGFPMPPVKNGQTQKPPDFTSFGTLWDNTDSDLRQEVLARRLERGARLRRNDHQHPN